MSRKKESRMSAKKVIVVSAGTYSDYHVVCACPSQKIAEGVAAKIREIDHRRDDVRVETLPLIASADDAYTYTMYCVETALDGTERRRWIYNQHTWDPDYLPSAVYGNAQNGFTARGVSQRGYDVALKIARDKAAEHTTRSAGLA